MINTLIEKKTISKLTDNVYNPTLNFYTYEDKKFNSFSVIDKVALCHSRLTA